MKRFTTALIIMVAMVAGAYANTTLFFCVEESLYYPQHEDYFFLEARDGSKYINTILNNAPQQGGFENYICYKFIVENPPNECLIKMGRQYGQVFDGWKYKDIFKPQDGKAYLIIRGRHNDTIVEITGYSEELAFVVMSGYKEMLNARFASFNDGKSELVGAPTIAEDFIYCLVRPGSWTLYYPDYSNEGKYKSAWANDWGEDKKETLLAGNGYYIFIAEGKIRIQDLFRK